MPVSVTKSSLSNDIINRMVKKAFGQEAEKIIKLTEGFFNAAYKIELDEKSVLLKISPPEETEIMTHEKNIMESEVVSMRMVKKETKVPVPEILFYDDSHTICNSSYFFMEFLEGKSFSSIFDKMEQKEKDFIFNKMGSYTYMLNQITNTTFGYFGQKDRQGKNWFEVFKQMIMDTYFDAERKNIFTPVNQQKLLKMLEEDRNYFEMVKEPKFVHWDIWAGNVFIRNNDVVGIIDFERCLWADPLMEVGFRTYGYENAFFEGYGLTKLSEEELRRAKWYDIYLFLISCLECDYRQYDNRGAYDWGCDMLNKWLMVLLKKI